MKNEGEAVAVQMRVWERRRQRCRGEAMGRRAQRTPTDLEDKAQLDRKLDDDVLLKDTTAVPSKDTTTIL